MSNTIELIARAVIIKERKILLCRNKDKGYYYLPGGHVEFGEKAKEALARELKEELETIETEKISFMEASENFFVQNGEKHHELNLIFSVMPARIKEKSKEDHIDFEFLSPEQVQKENILPPSIKQKILKWIKSYAGRARD